MVIVFIFYLFFNMKFLICSEKSATMSCDNKNFCLLSCTFVMQTCNVESFALQKKKILKGPLSNRLWAPRYSTESTQIFDFILYLR